MYWYPTTGNNIYYIQQQEDTNSAVSLSEKVKDAWQCPGCQTFYAFWVPFCDCATKLTYDLTYIPNLEETI